MDDLFDDFSTDLMDDSFLGFDLDNKFRNRAYTWPSKPTSVPSPSIVEPDTTPAQLTPLRTVTEPEYVDLQSVNSGNHIGNESPASPGSVGATRKVIVAYCGALFRGLFQIII